MLRHAFVNAAPRVAHAARIILGKSTFQFALTVQ
jgi:hypothetical protein